MQTKILGFSIFYIVVFLFNGLSNSHHAMIFNAHIPETKRSTLLSFESLVLQLGAVLGSVIMGYISKIKSISFAWYIGSIFLVLSSVNYLLILKTNIPGRQ